MKNQTAPGPVERLREIVLHGRAAGIPHATRLGYAIKLAESLVSPGMVEELARVLCGVDFDVHQIGTDAPGIVRSEFIEADWSYYEPEATAILTFLSAKALGEAD